MSTIMEKSVREKIYHELREQITYCRLNPGERLVEANLASNFNSSRSPIREALRQLESEGLITFARNRGYTVSKLSVKQVDEIYNIRWLLEGYAARLSAEKASKSDVQYLSDLNGKLKEAVRENDLKGWLQANTLFHTFFYENCGNENLCNILKTLQLRIHRYKFIIISIPGHFQTYLNQHHGILKACKNNDGEAAEQYMKHHIRTIKEILIPHLSNFADSVT